MDCPSIDICMPNWVGPYVARHANDLVGPEERMRFAIALSRENVRRGSGGPFAAAVFADEGSLIAAGVNMVVPAQCSLLHAEVVALGLAQAVVGRYDLGDRGALRYELVTTTQPCTMCFGAVLWSGVSRLVCGARDDDARAAGFDEGPRLPDWEKELTGRGVSVVRDVLRADAAAVLREYALAGSTIYNPGPAEGREVGGQARGTRASLLRG